MIWMSRVSKRKLIKILKGEYEETRWDKKTLAEHLAKPISQEEWLKGYWRWRKRMEKEIAKDKRTDS